MYGIEPDEVGLMFCASDYFFRNPTKSTSFHAIPSSIHRHICLPNCERWTPRFTQRCIAPSCTLRQWGFRLSSIPPERSISGISTTWTWSIATLQMWIGAWTTVHWSVKSEWFCKCENWLSSDAFFHACSETFPGRKFPRWTILRELLSTRRRWCLPPSLAVHWWWEGGHWASAEEEYWANGRKEEPSWTIQRYSAVKRSGHSTKNEMNGNTFRSHRGSHAHIPCMLPCKFADTWPITLFTGFSFLPYLVTKVGKGWLADVSNDLHLSHECTLWRLWGCLSVSIVV